MVLPKGICSVATIVLLLSIVSCKKENTYHYSENKLIDVIIDVHIAKAAIQNAPVEVRDSIYSELFGQICQIHHVHPDSLSMDLDKLTLDPDYLEKLYEVVIDSLEKTTSGQQAEY